MTLLDLLKFIALAAIDLGFARGIATGSPGAVVLSGLAVLPLAWVFRWAEPGGPGGGGDGLDGLGGAAW